MTESAAVPDNSDAAGSAAIMWKATREMDLTSIRRCCASELDPPYSYQESVRIPSSVPSAARGSGF